MSKLLPIIAEIPSIGKPRAIRHRAETFSAAVVRERKGAIHSKYFKENAVLQSSTYYQQYRQLTPKQYYQLYKSTPDVRACIDSIVRRVATWDWQVKPTIDPRESEYLEALRVSEECNSFLSRANNSGDTFQETMTKMVTDLLIYDAGVLELVEDDHGGLEEIVAFLGSEFFPITDDHGRLLYYSQQNEYSRIDQSSKRDFEPQEIAYFQLFPNTRTNLGTPLLDTLVNECVTVLLAHEHAMLALDADEIPPGLLILGGLAGPAADRAKADLAAMKGKDHKIRVITSSQPSAIEAKWLELRHTPKDLQMLEVVDELQRSIWRVFGVQPIELGVTSGDARATATTQVDVASSHLITPILELISSKINSHIISRLIPESMYGKIKFVWDRTTQLTPEQSLAKSRSYAEYLKKGVMTVNEVRLELGMMPVDGGDTPIVETNVGPIPLLALSQNVIPQIINDGVGAQPPQEEGEPEAVLPTLTDGGFIQESKNAHECTDKETIFGRVTDWRAIKLELPSDWQNPSRFKGKRVVDIRKLGDLVTGYARAIYPLYTKAADNCIASITARAAGNQNDIRLAKSDVDRIMNALLVEWSTATLRWYMDAAKLGNEGAKSITGESADWKLAATEYHSVAMAWLIGSTGLLSQIERSLFTIIDEMVVEPDEVSRAVDKKYSKYISRAAHSFKRNAFRVLHWSGKLVEVSNRVYHGIFVDSDSRGQIWYVKWDSVSDGNSCSDCLFEGEQPIRRAMDLSKLPTSGVRCGANCRCVLVYYTEKEVRDMGFF